MHEEGLHVRSMQMPSEGDVSFAAEDDVDVESCRRAVSAGALAG